MSQDYSWTDDGAHEHRSTAIFEVSDVTDEILGLARSLENEWFSHDTWIDWWSFFADLNCVVIPSTGRELDVGIEPGSPAMDQIQRHIRKVRMASIPRWEFAAGRTTRVDAAEPAPGEDDGSTAVAEMRSAQIPDSSCETR